MFVCGSLLVTFISIVPDTFVAAQEFWRVQIPRGMERSQAVSKLKESIFISEVRQAFIYCLLTP